MHTIAYAHGLERLHDCPWLPLPSFATIGDASELVLCAAKHPSLEERCAHFSAALLSGEVITAFLEFTSRLNIKAGSMASREARALVRVTDFIQAMLSQKVDCVSALASAWARDGALLTAIFWVWVLSCGARRLCCLHFFWLPTFSGHRENACRDVSATSAATAAGHCKPRTPGRGLAYAGGRERAQLLAAVICIAEAQEQ
jgi:hypothetical protein